MLTIALFFDEMRKQKLKLKEIEEKKTPFLEQPLKKLNLGEIRCSD